MLQTVALIAISLGVLTALVIARTSAGIRRA